MSIFLRPEAGEGRRGPGHHVRWPSNSVRPATVCVTRRRSVALHLLGSGTAAHLERRRTSRTWWTSAITNRNAPEQLVDWRAAWVHQNWFDSWPTTSNYHPPLATFAEARGGRQTLEWTLCNNYEEVPIHSVVGAAHQPEQDCSRWRRRWTTAAWPALQTRDVRWTPPPAHRWSIYRDCW